MPALKQPGPAWSKALALLALVCLLHWLFGNVYEQVVIAPNWVVDSGKQMDRLHAFFVRSTPTLYFVPLSLLASPLVWAAHACNRRSDADTAFRRASGYALVAAALNALIVATIAIPLFSPDYRLHSDAELHALCSRWNVLNALRMALTAATVFWTFHAFRILDRSADGANRVTVAATPTHQEHEGA